MIKFFTDEHKSFLKTVEKRWLELNLARKSHFEFKYIHILMEFGTYETKSLSRIEEYKNRKYGVVVSYKSDQELLNTWSKWYKEQNNI